MTNCVNALSGPLERNSSELSPDPSTQKITTDETNKTEVPLKNILNIPVGFFPKRTVGKPSPADDTFLKEFQAAETTTYRARDQMHDNEFKDYENISNVYVGKKYPQISLDDVQEDSKNGKWTPTSRQVDGATKLSEDTLPHANGVDNTDTQDNSPVYELMEAATAFNQRLGLAGPYPQPSRSSLLKISSAQDQGDPFDNTELANPLHQLQQQLLNTGK